MNRLASLLLLAAAACTTEPASGPGVTSYIEHKEIPMGFSSKIDVLFVVDNSPAMAAAQTKLASDYRAMVAELAKSPVDSVPDMHVGVVTTDLSAPPQTNGGFIAEATKFNWRVETNHPGTLADAFLARANVGSSGSTETRPFEAMKRALAPLENPAFVREDAYLAIVFLTAGDDRGTEDVAAVAQSLKQLKSDPSKVVVTGAFGACSENGITATAAPRLSALLAQFPNRSVSTTLCAPDLTPLTAITQQLYKWTLGIACMSNVKTPLDCAASLVDPESEVHDEVDFRRCEGESDTRCWTLAPDVACIAAGDLAVKMRPFRTPFPATAILECVAEHP